MKDILVVSDGGAEDEARFKCAESLAARFDGFLNVVVVTELPPVPVVAGEAVAFVPPDDELYDEALARGAKIKAAVERRYEKHVPPVYVSRVDATVERLGQVVAEVARTHDLCVATLPVDDASTASMNSAFDGILRDGCCGVLGIPPGGRYNDSFERVAIAWNGSKEASRAVARAMPLIKQAREVMVVLVDPPLRPAGKELRPGDAIIRHLDHHGISAALSRVASDDLRTSQAILAEAARTQSDLLVMGAQAAGGLLQWFQGSVSREVLIASSIPLLMAH